LVKYDLDVSWVHFAVSSQDDAMIQRSRNSTAARLTMTFAGAALAAVTILPGKALADDQDVIDYRQHAMKTMGEQVAAMAMMAENKVPGDNFAVHAQILADVAAMAKSAFTPKVVGGKAKAEVWANWDDFAKRLDALAASTADLAKTAQQGGVAAAAPKMQAALTCKGCHDTYRDDKK